MSIVIKSDCVDTRIRRRNREMAEIRRRQDKERGYGRHDQPARGDFSLCRELDKTIKDYKRFKDPRDREKIKNEYFGRQREYQIRKVLGIKGGVYGH